MVFEKIKEGKAEIVADVEDKVSKKLEFFYNPKMKYNRDTSVDILKYYFNDKKPRIALPLAGSGIRGIRFLLNHPCDVYFNDFSQKAIDIINENMSINEKKIKEKQGKFCKNISKKEANHFILSEGKFDYIDIDPFGSSVKFVDCACKALRHEGILAITNTDTAALCGTYPKVTSRRYNSKSFNYAARHEIGLRILAKKIQQMAMIYSKALIPVMSFAKDHYMRIYFKCYHSNEKCNKIAKMHTHMKADRYHMFSDSSNAEAIGPLWKGNLQDKKLLEIFDDKFSERIKNDAILDSLEYFADPHELCALVKRPVFSYKKLIEKINSKGFDVKRTSYCETALKTDISHAELIEIIKKI
ncbi:MAG: hypothetical protein ACQER9_01395 [Nanobdellota archaeon]